MKKASMLLSIFALLCLLLAAPAAYADQEPPVIDPPSETDVPPLAEDGEAEPEDIPADLPGGAPGGTAYAVSGAALPGQEADAAGQALTVVDYQLDGGGESGAVYAGQSIYYYGADIAGVTYGVQIDGAGCGYFGSSDGAIPLYDGKGAVAGIVWGDRRQSTIDCDVGFLVQGDVTGGFTVEDGTAINAKQELILCQSGSGSFRFNNARLHTDSGVLVRMAPDAGALTLSYKNGPHQRERLPPDRPGGTGHSALRRYSRGGRPRLRDGGGRRDLGGAAERQPHPADRGGRRHGLRRAGTE